MVGGFHSVRKVKYHCSRGIRVHPITAEGLEACGRCADRKLRARLASGGRD